ncbi:DUF2834 domain-containing protein [Almyronema epifaneia]|uniref:DUF2834 domain-containing protein n=1 Tax=Almyronema epifaneia S1 TaxID=2991925 RepID=A0ABW6IEJ7_9CYAN
MVRQISFMLLWVGFSFYAFLLAPANQPDTFELIQRLSTGDWAGINPLVVALFNLMGVWPLVYACVVLIDGQGQKLPAWPFVVGSFGVGAFLLLPYLALRQPQPTFTGEKSVLLKLVDARWLGVGLAIAAFGLLVYGWSRGDWSDFVQQWQTSRFIHVMSLDYCLLWLLFPALLGDDMTRRGIGDRRWIWLLMLIPVLGAAIYLVIRPPLPSKTAQPEAATV